MAKPTPKMTPRRLSCLLSVTKFGTVAVTVQFGWQTHLKLYTVHSLTELIDSTDVLRQMFRLGWIKRTYPGSTNYMVTSLGWAAVAAHYGTPHHVNCRCTIMEKVDG